MITALAVMWLVGLGSAAQAANPAQGPGGPILVVTSGTTNNGLYLAEILRTEGLNEFDVVDIGAVTPAVLASHDLVLLAKMPLVASQVSMLTNWVTGGGNLIAIAPDAGLSSLLGITPLGTTLANAYLLVDTGKSPGAGLVSQTIQFHGSASLYSLSGSSALATLYSNASTATASPAVTLNLAGSGRAAAFTYDLATSIVQSRQGNPAWAAQERDGYTPIRSDDKFYGGSTSDPQPDWIDLSKVAIPQADEQQRLLANLILQMNAAKKPLPRFWYFPNGKKAVVLMSGDDHGNGGTIGRFDQFIAASPSGCRLDAWECVRGTSYVFPNTPITAAQAAQYNALGFEIGLHVNTNCADYTPVTLEAFYAQQLADWQAAFTGLPVPLTERHHCIAWSDWTTGAETQSNHGMRLDTTFYFWPPGWVADTPGLFTSSAMPMRFARLDGSLVDVYNAATQITDESGQSFPSTVNNLLDRAVGDTGYFGVYTVNAHTDLANSTVSDAVVAGAQARGVPIVTARQMLTWLDARNASSFGAFGWTGSALSFQVTADPAAKGIQAMLPTRVQNRQLSTLALGSSNVAYTTAVIKGVEYAFFPAIGGAYTATYGADTTAPTVVSTSPPGGATSVSTRATISASFSDVLDPASVSTATVRLRDSIGNAVAANVSYNPATRSAVLAPNTALASSTSYTVTLTGGTTEPRIKDAAGNPLAANYSWSFTTAAPVAQRTCPCTTVDGAAAPNNPSVNDPNSVTVGVKFQSDVAGTITGVRFYKGTGNTGTHVGSLWSIDGTLLASATFTTETASGWQQVNFATPVPIAADTVYVAAYFAPNGHYAGDNNAFASAGIDNPPIHLLKNGVSGGDGVYQYGVASTFPTSSYLATNYWVDVVFATAGAADTTPPAVASIAPGAGASGVAVGAPVTARFSEDIDPATVSGSTFSLKSAANPAVAGTVSYNTTSRTASFAPSAVLSPATTYTATLRGGTADPRIKDVAGNPMAADFSWTFTTAAAAGGSCSTGATNPIVGENCMTGNPSSEWDITGAGDASIQGFATDISVNAGATVFFKVNTAAAAYRIDIYRMGYYGGLGARKVASVNPSASLPQTQPACLNDAGTGLIDCGNWAVSGSWAVPATAVSGIYLAKLVRIDTGGSSHIVFVVRNDAGTSSLLFQTSDTTWQAYNNYGGNSLYTGSPAGRAYKVSYNRPFNTRAVDGGQDWVFNAEYPMVRWLEANGYDVSYATGVDTERAGGQLLRHKVFMSVGHDEYWSGGQRSNVEAARAAGVNLAFFSGNEIFWKTRWENSIDGTSTAYRTLVTYKETSANARIDPLDQSNNIWTGTWRDPRFSPPADGGRPENALAGTIFMNNDTGTPYSITVPDTDGKLRFWRNTSVATLSAGQTATLPVGTLGYEWDSELDNGFRPAGLMRMSTTTLTTNGKLLDYGSTYGNGTVTHYLTLYKHASGARVFGAGTIQWPWGLDATHDRGNTPADARMQQATVNLFADMGVQPATLQPGLQAAAASTDTQPPSSVITSPQAGANVPAGAATTIVGTASDAGGGVVGGVEVSVDGGSTWHPATGRGSWTYAWTPTAAGPVSIKSRAVDDSGNLESPAAGVSVTVATRSCPCSIWSASSAPNLPSSTDTAAVNVGVKFQSDQSGYITGLRFYKGSGNGGTHVGALWTSGGSLLGTVTFSGETASGWQQANFATPIAISANTVYVASYLAPQGRYAGDASFFAGAGVDNAPLHALSNSAGGGNGVYAYGGSTAFPSSTYQSTNYWVDVVYSATAPADTTPPTVTTTSPSSGAQGVLRSSGITATFSEAMAASTINASTFVLTGPGGAQVTATVSYNASTRVATLTPTATLAATTSYTATVKGGGTDPRVKDLAGNALAANRVWTFTTGSQ